MVQDTEDGLVPGQARVTGRLRRGCSQGFTIERIREMSTVVATTTTTAAP